MKHFDSAKLEPGMRLANILQDARGLASRTVVGVAVAVGTIMVLLAIGGTPGEAVVLGLGMLALALALSYRERITVARALEAGRQLATRDTATDLPSSDYADHFVSTEFAAAQRGRAVTVVLFGFDAFDAFAASHGAAAADDAVREFGRILKQLTRKMNHSARYGWRADAFLSVLSESNADAAAIYVERVQEAVREAGRTVPMPAVSVGIAEFDPVFGTPQEFLEAAQHALAAARADGGSCIRRRDGTASRDDAGVATGQSGAPHTSAATAYHHSSQRLVLSVAAERLAARNSPA